MEQKKIKVLHMLTTDRYSGAENVVCQIARMFHDKTQCDIMYCSPDGPIREALKEREVSFYPIKTASVAEFRRAIRDTNPDIIHAHDMRAGLLAALVCGKITLISHIHNNNYDSRGISMKSILYYFAACKAKHIFWVSQSSFVGYCFHNALKTKSSVLYNIIDMGELQTRAKNAECKDSYDVVYLGRLTFQKNPQRLIAVLSAACKKVPTMKVAIIGSGEMENEIRTMIEMHSLEKNINYLGFMTNPYGIVKNAKLMVMTSRWEGTPMCALEAMALGIPIVSTPTDGLCELVANGKTGYLCETNEELVSAIVRIVQQSELQRVLSDESIKRAAKLMEIEKYRQSLYEKYIH